MRRLNAKRNLIYYPGDIITPTSDLTTMKLHVKRVISDVKENYMCMEVKKTLTSLFTGQKIS